MHARLAVLDALEVLRDAPARVVAQNRAGWRLHALPVVAERQERRVLAEQRPVEIAEEEERAAACRRRLLLQAARVRVGCERGCGAEGYRSAEGTQHAVCAMSLARFFCDATPVANAARQLLEPASVHAGGAALHYEQHTTHDRRPHGRAAPSL